MLQGRVSTVVCECTASNAYDDTPGRDITSVQQPCQSKNWIQLEYRYAEGTGLPQAGKGVPHARYVVQRPNHGEPGGEVLAEGTLDANGYAYVCLPDDAMQVEVYFEDDPEGEEYQEQFEQPPGWREWLWGVIQGDFNENPTVGQVVADTVVTMIPGLDQAGDIRDFSANLKKLLWDKQYGDKGAWFGLFTCFIGLVPTLGSLAKGVLKYLRRAKAPRPSILFRIFNGRATGNALRWLKKLGGQLPEYAMQAAGKFEMLMLRVGTHRWSPGWLGEVAETLRGMVRSQFASLAVELQNKLLEAVNKALDSIIKSQTGTTLKVSQIAQQGTLKANYQQLRKRLDTQSGYQAHHVIPVGEAKNSQAMQHAESLGYDINRVSNGISLPNSATAVEHSVLQKHGGSHPQYSKAVRDALDKLDQDFAAGRLTDEKLLSRVAEIEKEFKTGILSGKYVIN